MSTLRHIAEQQEFRYKAVRVKQTNSGDWLVLFAASAIEIDMWVGIPQKKQIGTQETTGFQREENPKRIREIESFYEDEVNIVQNPLLCALRQTTQGKVVFESNEAHSEEDVQYGYLIIKAESLKDLSLLELLKRVKADLEKRVPELVNHQPSDNFIRELKQRAEINSDLSKLLNEVTDDQEDNADLETSNDINISFTNESHIFDFWEEVSAYVSVLEEIKDTFDGDKFLDYSKEAMISFLRPIVIVDGQHRLRAAIASAKSLVKSDIYKDAIEQALINKEGTPEEVQRRSETEAARNLPVSLLMNSDPAEQVFQFVVVNQKATPIKPALLGTIVSTSLSNEELDRVANRLENAGIKLEESRAVTFLARHQESPFCNLVERGLSSDSKERLKWNVLALIVRIFRDLKGGQLYGEKNDYADKWKRYYLEESQIINQWENKGFESAFEYWRQLDGPWRDVFMAFWTIVSNKLADNNNDDAWHYWGNPKQSNIFNKTSLTILAADFFQYLTEVRKSIDSKEQVSLLVEDWLRGVDENYFNRDWNLHGVKKDVPGIRKRWAQEWVQYRKDPQRLPGKNVYRNPVG